MADQKILILGIGNVLMGDEGIGVEAIRKLQSKSFPENVTILDGGTGGFHLLGVLCEFPVIIMIDATLDNNVEGTINFLEPKFSTEFPKSLSAHDIGLKDLIESLFLLDRFPKTYLFTVSIKKFQTLSLNLSPAIENSIPELVGKVERLVNELNRNHNG